MSAVPDFQASIDAVTPGDLPRVVGAYFVPQRHYTGGIADRDRGQWCAAGCARLTALAGGGSDQIKAPCSNAAATAALSMRRPIGSCNTHCGWSATPYPTRIDLIKKHKFAWRTHGVVDGGVHVLWPLQNPIRSKFLLLKV